MSAETFAIPAAPRYILAGASVPESLLGGTPAAARDDLCAVDLTIAGGSIESIVPAGDASLPRVPRIDLARRVVLPCFVDAHTHLDKGHIFARAPNPDGTFASALAAVASDREARWSGADVRARMDFALRAAYVHGTRAVRTHIDSIAPQDGISWPVFTEIRDAWAGRVELQGVSLVGIEQALEPNAIERLAETVAAHGGVLGAVTYTIPRLEAALDTIFTAAEARGLDLDFHADESGDPTACSLRAIAETALRRRFSGRIVAGHCCSLAAQPDPVAEETLDRVAEAGIAVVSLPLCNLYLQDRVPGRTPRWRGVTLVHEMRARGIPVAFGSDNTRDPFYAYGDLDMLEVFREATRIAHLDHPIDGWVRAVTDVPARMMGLAARGSLEAGAPADLVLLSGRTLNEVLSRPGADRLVLRAGRAIDRELPHYAELDRGTDP